MGFSRAACLSLLVWVLGVAPTFGQQGPTSGSIDGTVTDTSGAVMPGVAVTATSPNEIGHPTVITNGKGQYRFPALTPGIYSLKFELAGFNTMIRQNVRTYINFTATADVQLQVATMSESVTVVAETPLIDSRNTTFQEIIRADVLEDLPNSRDMWAIIGEAPGTRVNSFDVGGTLAGSQSSYSSYGYAGGQGRNTGGITAYSVDYTQNRIQVDGVNSTSTSGGGQYLDYGAFEQVQLGTASNDASMPVPGVSFNGMIRSGTNKLASQQTYQFFSQRFQDRNVTPDLRRQGIGNGTRLVRLYDINPNLGGPVMLDKLWFFTSIRQQNTERAVAAWPANAPGTGSNRIVRLQNATYKLTYQLSKKDKLQHFAQFSRRVEPNGNPGTDDYLDAVALIDRPSWAGNIEWQRAHSSSFFFVTRLSTFGSNGMNRPFGLGNEAGRDVRNRMTETTNSNVAGGDFSSRTDRRRYQLDWTGTKFLQTRLVGDHSLRVGYSTEWETANDESTGYKDHLRLQFRSPVGTADFTTPYRVTIYNTPNLIIDSLWHHSGYVQDQIRIGRRLTINPGVRWDFYSSYYPDQPIPDGPYRNFFYAGAPLPNGYTLPATYPDFRVPGRSGTLKYSAFGPRLGAAWTVGKEAGVLKASWGRYYANSSTTISDNLNPAQALNTTFGWNDVNGDRLFQPNEFGNFVSNTGSTFTGIDPNLARPYVDEMNVWYERRLARNMSGRVGFIRKKSNDEWQLVNITRPGSLWSSALQGVDPGLDGLVGTPDDVGPFTYYDIPAGVTIPRSESQWQAPRDNDSDFRSIDLTLDKRLSGRWSGQVSYSNTWTRTLNYGHPDNPNEEINNLQKTRIWTFKITAIYQAPWGFVVTPKLRMQDGSPMGRFVRVSTRTNSTTDIVVEPTGTYREPATAIWDMRIQKRFKVNGAGRVSLYADVYNLLNSNTATGRSQLTGRRRATVDGEAVDIPNFGRATGILSPRVLRFGVSFNLDPRRATAGKDGDGNRGRRDGDQGNDATAQKDKKER